MDTKIRHLIIPVTKESTGEYLGILSDDSIDRDNEFMASELISEWANSEQSLPMLANHDNSMQSFLGAWKSRQLITSEDGHTGLAMKPTFFSEDANPLSKQIQTQIDEALKMGLNPGISIGFIPMEGLDTPQGYKHTKAEIVEASFVPVQSNRNAYAVAAKRYRIGETVKKGTAIIGDGVDMVDNKDNIPEKQSEPLAEKAPDPIAVLTDAMNSLAQRVSALEQMMKSPTQEEAAKAEEDMKRKAEQEKKIAEQLESYKKELEAVKAAINAPKAKIPGSMLNPAGVGKDAGIGEKKYNATEDWLRRKELM